MPNELRGKGVVMPPCAEAVPNDAARARSDERVMMKRGYATSGPGAAQ